MLPIWHPTGCIDTQGGYISWNPSSLLHCATRSSVGRRDQLLVPLFSAERLFILRIKKTCPSPKKRLWATLMFLAVLNCSSDWIPWHERHSTIGRETREDGVHRRTQSPGGCFSDRHTVPLPIARNDGTITPSGGGHPSHIVVAAWFTNIEKCGRTSCSVLGAANRCSSAACRNLERKITWSMSEVTLQQQKIINIRHPRKRSIQHISSIRFWLST